MDWLFGEINPNGTDWQLVIIFVIFAAFITYAAYKRGYFRFPLEEKRDLPNVRFWHVLIGFSFYLFLLFFLSPILSEISKGETLQKDEIIAHVSWVNFAVLSSTAAFILIVFGGFFRDLFKRIIKSSHTLIRQDLLLAIFSWVISFPYVIIASEILDGLTTWIFKLKEIPEQVAIQYFQMAQKYPGFLAIALVTIILLAPFVEEFMFRGLLQNWFKRIFGFRKAIVFSSILFALFHFSPSQGVGNISIVGALFILALFLGFIYERQGSLFASFFLHSIFNTLSILNLLFIKSS